MKRDRPILFALWILAIAVILPSLTFASGSENFFQSGKEIYDEWGIYRTRANGTDGFLGVTPVGFEPKIAYESLGDNAEATWQFGEDFAQRYPDRHQRAEELFYFVRDRVRYTSDSDQFGMREFAQNADEVLATIKTHGIAQGDCEDSAILLSVLYKAAGFRSAIVLTPGHVATLIHLPEYRKAPRKLILDGEDGWVWIEATGATNPFGWVPDSLLKGDLIAKEITNSHITSQTIPGGAVTISNDGLPNKYGSLTRTGTVIFLGSIGFLWMIGGRQQRSKSS